MENLMVVLLIGGACLSLVALCAILDTWKPREKKPTYLEDITTLMPLKEKRDA